MSLDFHREIFSDLLDDDGILIMAQGLGIHKVSGKGVERARVICKKITAQIPPILIKLIQ
jgi:hypothetical protein